LTLNDVINVVHTMEETEKKILSILSKSDGGVTITELVALSGSSRSTIRVVLARLEGGDKISFREIGMAKVYHLGGSHGR
jgi:predicted transcriptional regulator